MKAMTKKELILGFLLIGAVVFSMYALFEMLRPQREIDFESSADGDVPISNMPSFTLPISEVFKIKANTTYFFKVNIGTNVTLIGNLKEASGMCIKFYVLNETNMKRWLADQSFSAYVSFEGGKEDFIFTTDQEGVYYFVFDNRVLFFQKVCQDKLIIFNLRAKEQKAEGD